MNDPDKPHAQTDMIEKRDRLALEHQSARAWKHPAESIEPTPEAQRDLITQLAEALTPVFAFISRGRLGRTMEHRSWVVLYLTRSDLIRDESLEDAAKRFGVSPQRMHEFVAEFRSAIPGYRDSKRLDSTKRKKAHSPTPGGGRNLFAKGSTSAGSAST
jgi:hypothetical protein